MDPLVSVIIPGYNHAAYLHERIESVLAQDYQNFEIILLDDCSPNDNSAEIMLSYKDNQHVSHVVINEKNSGNTFIQWERGIMLAKGDYIWIAESDDVADPAFLSRTMGKLSSHPDAVLAFTHSVMIDADSKPLDYSWDQPWLYRNDGVYDSIEFRKERLVLKNLLYNASMIVWRKNLYDNVSKDFQKYRHCGDWLFWYEIVKNGRVVEIPEKLNMFRQHSQKVSNNSKVNRDDLFEIGDIMSRILKDLSASSSQYRSIRGRMTKRSRKLANKEQQEQLRRRNPDLFDGSLIDILFYTLDKYVNFSGYQNDKH